MEPFDLKIGKLTVRVESGDYYAYRGGVNVRVFRRFGDEWAVRLECRGAYAIEGHDDPQEAARLALASYRRDAREGLRAVDPKRVAKRYDGEIADLRKKVASATKARAKALAAAKKRRPLVEARAARALEAFR